MQVYRPGDGPTTRHKGAGSLKTEELEGRYFRDRKIAAPLKHHIASQVKGCLTTFPRSKDRGPIEAEMLATHLSMREDFRDRKIAAPLKLAERREFRTDPVGFPRSKDRGPIEASTPRKDKT